MCLSLCYLFLILTCQDKLPKWVWIVHYDGKRRCFKMYNSPKSMRLSRPTWIPKVHQHHQGIRRTITACGRQNVILNVLCRYMLIDAVLEPCGHITFITNQRQSYSSTRINNTFLLTTTTKLFVAKWVTEQQNAALVFYSWKRLYLSTKYFCCLPISSDTLFLKSLLACTTPRLNSTMGKWIKEKIPYLASMRGLSYIIT